MVGSKEIHLKYESILKLRKLCFQILYKHMLGLECSYNITYMMLSLIGYDFLTQPICKEQFVGWGQTFASYYLCGGIKHFRDALFGVGSNTCEIQ